ncbi:head-tail connector protein [Eubacteriales bacterium OttesenSCG-928-A19]|nr:head-tail connector protein [Eubacteriales bacterium OttesenSCG-928-A19]
MVTLAELKAHLRIEHDEEDTYLDMLLAMAQTAALDFCKLNAVGRCKPPEPMRLAILLYASYFFTNRESGDASAYKTMIQAFHALLWPYRNTEKLV